MTISDIIEECWKCKDFRAIEKEQLRTDLYEYSCSDETRDAIEDMDPTGRKLEQYCTNLDFVQEHDAYWAKQHQLHILSCQEHGCAQLRAYRKDLKIEGYENA